MRSGTNIKSNLVIRSKFAANFLRSYINTFWRLLEMVVRNRFARVLPMHRAGALKSQSFIRKFVVTAPILALFLCKELLRKLLINPIKRVKAKFQFIHENISSRALYALVDSYSSESDSLEALTVLGEKISYSPTKVEPYKLVSALILALKATDIAAARFYAKRLIDEYPNSFSEHQQAGIWFFIGGHYSDAEAVWGQSAELRESAIVSNDLVRRNMRILGKSWLLAIGHIAHIDIYLKHKILTGHSSQRTIIQMPHFAKVPNMALLNCWANHIEIVQSDWTGEGLNPNQYELLVDEFWSLRLSPGETRMFSHAGAKVQQEWERQGRAPLVQLSQELEESCWMKLESLGVPRKAWFVCLHVREPGFHRAWHEKHPGTRNADVLTYLKAIQQIIDNGGWVVRMGDSTMKPMPERKGLIDYAHSPVKCQEMDVFLCAKARFFIGTNSGLGLVPPIFGVPCALTNWTPIAIPQWYGRDRFIPKSIYSKKLGRSLTLRELLGSPTAWQQFQSYLDEHDLEAQDNTEDEIAALVEELLQETLGREYLTSEDRQLAEQYNNLAVSCGSYAGARPGRAWLRKHAAELQSLDLRAGPISRMP